MKWKASWLVAGLAGVAVGWSAHALLQRRGEHAEASAARPSRSAPVGAARPDAIQQPALPQAHAPAPIACADELARTRAELEKRLSPAELFERGVPNPDAERRIGAEIERVLKDRSASHALACRGQVCKVDVLERRDGPRDWMEPLQSDEQLLRVATGRMFGNTKPVKDPVSGEPLIHSEAYFQLSDPDVTPGIDVLRTALKAFKSGRELAACGRQFSTVVGDLEVAASLVDGQGFTVETGGTLAMTDAGNCIEAALRAALASVRLPGRYSSGVVHTQFKLP